MLAVLAIVERGDLSVAEGGIETSSFDQVGAGIQTTGGPAQRALRGNG